MSEFKRREGDIDAVTRALKWIAGVITSIAVIGGAVAFAADTRYAQKDDVKAEMQNSVNQLRKQALEDKIFELNLTPAAKRSDAQRALLDRSVRQLDDLNRK
jgi:hypothetical protein